ncbi:hypothetical protein CCR92_05180, partial [Rhodospirillum rubrum]|nr:hypothetical protein [Rhodospirillum rubrum]
PAPPHPFDDRPDHPIQDGTQRHIDPSDNTTNIITIAQIPSADMHVLCEISEDDYLSEWYETRNISLLFVAFFLSLFYLSLFILYFFWRRQKEDATRLRESNEQTQTVLRTLRESDNALAAACEVGGLSTFILDLSANLWMRSPEQEAIFGLDGRHPRTRDAWHALIYPEDRGGVLDYFAERDALDTGEFDIQYRIIRPSDGAVRWIHGAGKLERAEDLSVRRLVGAIKDVTEIKEDLDRTEFLAYHDSLTNLPNRLLLADRMGQALALAVRRQDLLAVCYLDLDSFKPINDTWGHSVGDALLIEVARRLQQNARAEDTVARLGGDEFVVLLCGFKAEAEVERVVRRMMDSIATPYSVGGRQVTLTVSMGITTFPRDAEQEADALIRHADQAMYEAKRQGRNRIHYFDAEKDRLHKERQTYYNRMVAALEANEFQLHYQPTIDLVSGVFSGVEALIRWRHPERGLLLPGAFLPDIEDTDLTVPLGEWILREALRQKERWQDMGLSLTVGVNLFGYHLQQDSFVARFAAILAEFPAVHPEEVTLEIVETTAMRDLAAISEKMWDCKRFGVDFALDDFGTGYSSLTYFRRLPVTHLKIDRSFVTDILENAQDQAMVQSIVAMSHALGRKVVAEGAETLAHCAALGRYGCDFAQGFGIARPMPGEDIFPWARQWNRPDSLRVSLGEAFA